MPRRVTEATCVPYSCREASTTGTAPCASSLMSCHVVPSHEKCNVGQPRVLTPACSTAPLQPLLAPRVCACVLVCRNQAKEAGKQASKDGTFLLNFSGLPVP